MLRLRLVRSFTSKAGRISATPATRVFRNELKPSELTKSPLDEAAIKVSDAEPSLLQHLKDRGLVANVTEDSLEELLQKNFTSFYLGIDPSGPSMHLGHMVPVMVMLHLFLRGHFAFALVGGATGAVGDPTGKNSERVALEKSALQSNLDSLASSLERTFLHAVSAAKKEGVYYGDQVKLQYAIVNNHDWWKNVGFLEFLASYGRLIRVNQMMARDSVKGRLDTAAGLGYNEFSYQILQAFDFWHLFETQGCALQLGGGDQWGNITAGVDLAKRAAAVNDIKRTPYGVTTQLMLHKNGMKLGKSEGNTHIWLNPEMTRPFELYQHLLQIEDTEVEQYLKMFTFVSLEEIAAIMKRHGEDTQRRHAQLVLAEKFTALIHGDTAVERCKIITRIMFLKSQLELNQQDKPAALTDPELLKQILTEEGLLTNHEGSPDYVTILSTHFDMSKAAAKRMISGGGVSVGLEDKLDKLKITGGEVQKEHLEFDQFVIVRVGKKIRCLYLGEDQLPKSKSVVGISDSYEVHTEDIDVTRK
ncbi:Tyrosine--tRNA ligase [Yarrowia sp. B02]|nr:Tyrosine--tRNA ligase [Yarrowia sp. B02]